MPDERELKFRVSGESKDADRALKDTAESADRAEKDLREMGVAGQEAGRRVSEGMKGLGDSAEAASGHVDELANTLAALVSLEAIRRFAANAVEAARSSENAILGLESVAENAGIGIGRAFIEVQQIAADGLLSVGEASTSLQNLLARGYSLDQAIRTLERLKDAAAFNRSAHLSLGEAVVSATEGLKNENSVLVDNAGVTKNVSVLWQEYADRIGITVNNLTQAQKVQAEFEGIQRETAAQAGNAAKSLDGIEGAIARVNTATQDFNQTFGSVLFPTIEKLAQAGEFLTREFLVPFAGGVEFLGSAVGKVVEDFRDIGNAVFGNDALADLPKRLIDNATELEQTAADIAQRWDQGLTPAMERAAAAAAQVADGTKQITEESAGATEQQRQLAEQMRGLTGAAAAETNALDGLDAALKALNLDMQELQTGLSAAEREIIRTFDIIISHPAVSGDQIGVALERALKRVSTNAAPALEQSLQRAFQEGQIGEEELRAGLDRINQALFTTATGYDLVGVAAQRSGQRQRQSMELTAEAILGVNEATKQLLTSFEIMQSRATALEAFRKGLLTPEQLGAINQALDREAAGGQQAAQGNRQQAPRRRPGTDWQQPGAPAGTDWQQPGAPAGTDWQPAGAPSGTDWQGEASRGRTAMEREFSARPLEIPVRFTLAAGEIQDADLMKGS